MAAVSSIRAQLTKPRIVAALWLVVVAGCILLVLGPGNLWEKGGPTPVATYIKNVDSLQKQMSVPLASLLTAYRGFAKPTGDPKELAQLARAERTLRTFERRLIALPAPPAAATLRLRLVQFVRDEDRVAVEISQLAHFAPRFRTSVSVAAIANAALARSLAAAKPPKAHVVRGTAKQIAAVRAAYAAAARRTQAEQADAVDAYDGALALALRSLRKLRPPPVFAPAFLAEVHTLEATRRAGAALAQELRKANTKNVPVLGRRFTVASRLSGSLAAQRAEIAAVKAYNRRVRGLTKAEAAIQDELRRLQSGR